MKYYKCALPLFFYSAFISGQQEITVRFTPYTLLVYPLITSKEGEELDYSRDNDHFPVYVLLVKEKA